MNTTSFVRKDMTGTIFTNDRKSADTDPDRTGEATINGAEFRINGWLRKDSKGRQYLALSFRPKTTTTPPPSIDSIDW